MADRITSERNLNKVTTGDFSGGGLLNRQQFDEFFQIAQDAPQIMDQVRFERLAGPKQQIDRIGVGERLLREATEAQSGSLNDPNTDSIDMDATKMELPWEVSMETVEDTIEGEGTADILVDKFARQFGIDSEDLAFNGDESSGDPFLGINDGWIVDAETQGPAANVDHQNATVDKTIFSDLMTSLDPKYRRNPENLVFMTSLNQKQNYKEYLTDRSTAAGDAMLMSGEEPTPYGRPIVTPVGFPDDRIMLTTPMNLVWGVHRDVNMRVTQEGEAVVKRDLYGIYNLLARTDYKVEAADAVALAQNVATA
jgi:HK97 family phage major capsid protein